jgi:dipeptidyl aminopeptidase/acylaminoacyl peptidase
MPGFAGNITSIEFNPIDGSQIIIGKYDSTIRLWDITSGREIRIFAGHSSTINSVKFSPDGKQFVSSSDDCTTRLWDVATGNEIACFISFSGNDTQLTAASRGLTVETETTTSSVDGEWLSITPDGYYQASPRGDRYLNVRVNNTVSGIDSYRTIFYNPDVVQARLQGRRDPASKSNVTIQQAAAFIPPTVTIQSPTNSTTTNTATTNLSVAITSTNQPIRNIKILVNGRLIGRDELTSVTGTGLQPERASLTVTDNQKTVNFTLPLELEPGNNRIEVVAFNGYSENRRYVDVTRNAPAGERPPLPNLWIVAVGVNGYDNAGPRLGGLTNLNFAVADAKGLIDSLKAQEGRRYAKVNSMLIADGERLVPTTENIRQGFRFLEGADPRRDVVVLFLAGHGISGQGGLFYFLPKDAAMSADKVVDASRAISGDEIMTVLDAPGNRLVFIDACQSGGVDNDRMVRSLMDTNAFVFAASRGNELSYEDARLGHGYFTYSIMTALGGAPAALAQGNVSVLSMSGYVKDDVPKRTNGRQNPSAYSLGFYDFPVAVIGR